MLLGLVSAFGRSTVIDIYSADQFWTDGPGSNVLDTHYNPSIHLGSFITSIFPEIDAKQLELKPSEATVQPNTNLDRRLLEDVTGREVDNRGQFHYILPFFAEALLCISEKDAFEGNEEFNSIILSRLFGAFNRHRPEGNQALGRASMLHVNAILDQIHAPVFSPSTYSRPFETLQDATTRDSGSEFDNKINLEAYMWRREKARVDFRLQLERNMAAARDASVRALKRNSDVENVIVAFRQKLERKRADLIFQSLSRSISTIRDLREPSTWATDSVPWVQLRICQELEMLDLSDRLQAMHDDTIAQKAVIAKTIGAIPRAFDRFPPGQ